MHVGRLGAPQNSHQETKGPREALWRVLWALGSGDLVGALPAERVGCCARRGRNRPRLVHRRAEDQP